MATGHIGLTFKIFFLGFGTRAHPAGHAYDRDISVHFISNQFRRNSWHTAISQHIDIDKIQRIGPSLTGYESVIT